MRTRVMALCFLVFIVQIFISPIASADIISDYEAKLDAGNWQHLKAAYGGNCKEFARKVMSEVFGAYLYPTASDNRFFTSGNAIGGLYSNFSAQSVKAALKDTQIGDVLQMSWYSSNTPHTLIIRSRNDNGIHTLEANSPNAGEIKNNFRTWQELASAYSNARNGGFTIYRYINKLDNGGGGGGSSGPEITTDSNLGNVTKGTYFDKLLSCTGNAAYWEKTGGDFPSGLDIDKNGGRLFGTINGDAKTYTFKIKATNNLGSNEKTFSLTVTQSSGGGDNNSGITTDSNLGSITNGTYFDKLLSCKGETAYLEKTGGDFPNGLNIDNNSGRLYGTINASAKTYSFRIKASNNLGSTEKTFTLNVVDPNSNPVGDALYL